MRPMIPTVCMLRCLVCLGLVGVALAAERPLNVVFILADDLGWGEIGCYGQQRIPTPHLDRLAAQGVRFTQHYSGAPVCAPSRCVLLTGRHLGRAEIRGNLQARTRFPEFAEGQYPLSAAAVTVAQVFQRGGYATGAFGKWGLGPVGSTGDPNRKGFDLFFGYNCQAVAHSYYPPHLWRNAEKVPVNARPLPGHARQPEGEVQLEDWLGEVYAPHLMLAEAERFIAAQADRPFFLYLPFIEPHVAMHPPRESVERFPAAWDTEVYRGENGYLPHPRPRAAYAAMIHDLDSHVGRVLEALDRAGVSEHTLVIFSSDNGSTHPGQGNSRFHVGGADPPFFHSTAGLRGYKGSVYEGGLRVPMIARLPGRIAPGTVQDAPSYFADWFPTLCEAAGLPTPPGLDGVSLWPVLTGAQPTLAARPPMLWVFPEYGGQVAVRLGHFKLVRQNLKTPAPGPWEVYDLARDPGETTDLAATRPDLVREAEDLLRREVRENAVFPVPLPGVPPATRTSGEAVRPNVLLILADDQGSVDLGCYGAKDLHTPHLDALAASGVRFNQFYAAAPVCSPSRAGTLTGRWPVRAGVPGNCASQKGAPGALPPAEVTLAEMFRAAGYATAHVGKWHLGYTPDTSPQAQGFDHSFGHMGGCMDNYSHFFYWSGPNTHDLWRNGVEVFHDGEYFPDLMVREATRFMEAHRDRPFFLYYALNTPHYPYQGEARWLERFRDLPYPRNLYAAFLAAQDERLGRLLDRVRELGLRERTLVVFHSDNGHSTEERAHFGGGSAGPYRGAKFSLLEGGIRLPALMAWPGRLPAGAVRDQMAHACDLLPTLAELAGVPPPGVHLDGRSLVRVLHDPDAPSPHDGRSLHWQVGQGPNADWAVRAGDWKLLGRTRDTTDGRSPTALSLFLANLQQDPGETTDLAARHPEVVARLRRLHDEHLD